MSIRADCVATALRMALLSASCLLARATASSFILSRYAFSVGSMVALRASRACFWRRVSRAAIDRQRRRRVVGG